MSWKEGKLLKKKNGEIPGFDFLLNELERTAINIIDLNGKLRLILVEPLSSN